MSSTQKPSSVPAFNEAWKNVENFNKNGFSAVHVRGSKGHDLKRVVVDIVERDIGGGQFEVNVLMYTSPRIPKETLEQPIINTCKEIFGEKMDHSKFDAVWRDTMAIAEANKTNPIGLEVAGKPGIFNVFEIVIKHPASLRYNVEGLEVAFLPALNKNLASIK